MEKFNISLVAKGLIAYAVERQIGSERVRLDGSPSPAERPIRFTYFTLSGGFDPPNHIGDFVSGIVSDAEAVKATELYQKVTQWCPDAQSWRAICSVYVGGNAGTADTVTDADDFDMSIIREDEYRFLKQPSIRHVDGWELEIPVFDMIQALRIEPGTAPEIITVPNKLESLQAAVGGHIEALGLDRGVCLICNEEGKLLGLPANRQVGGDIIAGTFLIVGEADGEFCSLSDTDAAHYTAEFAQPLLSCGGPDESTQWEFHVF